MTKRTQHMIQALYPLNRQITEVGERLRNTSRISEPVIYRDNSVLSLPKGSAQLPESENYAFGNTV